jgi:hypothetical protein
MCLVDRQLAAGCDLHLGEYVSGPPAGEIARNHVRREREAGAHELFRHNGGRQRLAVHKHAVAIEDDHGSSRRLGRQLRPTHELCGRISDAEDSCGQSVDITTRCWRAVVHRAIFDSGDNWRTRAPSLLSGMDNAVAGSARRRAQPATRASSAFCGRPRCPWRSARRRARLWFPARGFFRRPRRRLRRRRRAPRRQLAPRLGRSWFPPSGYGGR